MFFSINQGFGHHQPLPESAGEMFCGKRNIERSGHNENAHKTFAKTATTSLLLLNLP